MDRDVSLVRVERVPTEWEASLLVQLLADNDIRAMATGGFTASFLAESPGYVSVMVASEDETKARELIGNYFRRKSETSRRKNIDDEIQKESGPQYKDE